MIRRRSTSSRPTSNQTLALAAVGILAVFGCIFLFTGLDPLGMFGSSTPDPILPAEPGSQAAWQVYFTDPSRVNNPDDLTGSLPEKLIGYINSAQTSIHIAAFEFNLTPVAEALVAAYRRGVDVRWVTDDENGLLQDGEEGHGQFAILLEAGIPVRDDSRGALMHNKFWIFDGQIVWTGSTNITKNDNFRNNNNLIIVQSAALAAIYEREFTEMWEGEFGPRSPSTVDQQSITVDGIPIQVYFAAEDEVMQKIIPLVEQADQSIRFMAFSFTHDGLTQAMLERAGAGVEVQGIFETRGSETQFSALRPLLCAGLPVRQDGNPGTFHHKVIVLDEETVITGSLNFSANADESNDENTLIITSQQVAGLYYEEFQRRWQEAASLDVNQFQCE